MGARDRDPRELAQEIEDQIKNMISKEDLNSIPLEASSEVRLDKFIAKIGGAPNLVEGSAAKRLYEATTFWETGLKLARAGFGFDAINLLFRALVTDKRGCLHRMIGTHEPNNPDGSHKWIGSALEVAKRQMEQVRNKITPAQKRFMEQTLQLKLMVLRSHFSDNIHRPTEGLMEIEEAIQLVHKIRAAYPNKQFPQSPPGITLWLPDESPFSDFMVAKMLNIKATHFTIMTFKTKKTADAEAYKKQTLLVIEEELKYNPNSSAAYMCKAANLFDCSPDDVAQRKQAMECYKKAIDLLPADDSEKAIASYMYAYGVIIGLVESDLQVGMLKGLCKRAEELEDIAYPIFGGVECEGKFFMKDTKAELENYRDEDCIAKIQIVSYSTEQEREEKIKASTPEDMLRGLQGIMQKKNF